MERFKNFCKWLKEAIAKCRRYIGTDGLLHIETSFILVLLFRLFMPAFFAVLAALVLGLAKEVVDIWWRKSNTWRQALHDIICDLAGILLGVALFSLWTVFL